METGYEFVFIKVTQGSAYSSKHIMACSRHAQEARNAGLKVGYYHYAEPDTNETDAVSEADYFMQTMKDFGFPQSPFPWVLDIEDPQTHLSKVEIGNWISLFRKRCTLNTDKGILLYSYTPWLDEHLSKDHTFGDMPLWIASYPKVIDLGKTPKLPLGWEKYDVWQYTNKEKVKTAAGKEIEVDANIMHPDFWLKYIK
jgi:lysozyme